ncbi:chaperone HtpG [Capnocytophaga gingivalis]|uniref:chaperone HtpG n=1 Tax=Capnocytophaga gingivalis TaxID=1017 RepID=UPI003C742FCE
MKEINNFDQLYIIQQGGRGITKEDIIKRLESAIAKDAEGVYYAKKQLWQKLEIDSPDKLQKACETKALSQSPAFDKFRDIILITK